MSDLSQVLVETQRRGPTTKVTITFVAVVENIVGTRSSNSDTHQTSLYVGEDLNSEVYFKFNWRSTKRDGIVVFPHVGVRKRTQSYYPQRPVQNTKVGSTDEILVTCGKFNKILPCLDVWVEAPISAKAHSSTKTRRAQNGDELTSLLYILKVDVTVKGETPKPLLINSKLYEDTELTDFQLHASDGSVPFHKTMLSLHSDTLRALLRGEWKKSEGHINIDGVTVQTVNALKDYIYLGTLPDNGLESLLLVAAHYHMIELKSDCIAKLAKTVKTEDYERLVEFASQGCEFLDLLKALIFKVPGDIIDGA